MNETFILTPTLDEVPSGPLRDFYEQWLKLKDAHHFPQRKHFSPAAFSAHIAWMALNEYDAEKDQFRVKVFGTKYADIVGHDFTNQTVSHPNLIAKFNQVVTTGQPYISLDNRLTWSDRSYRMYDVMACPLFHADHSVSHILFRVQFHTKQSHT